MLIICVDNGAYVYGFTRTRRDISHIKQNLKNSIQDLEKFKQFELYEKESERL
mgnify:CR=1 FL=1